MVIFQMKRLKARHVCPAGGQGACRALTLCTQQSLWHFHAQCCQFAKSFRTGNGTHRSDYFGPEKVVEGLSGVPSWRARSLQSTDTLHQAICMGTPTHIAVNQPCASDVQDGSQHTSQIVLAQNEVLQTCHACPAGGQGTCTAVASCSQHFQDSTRSQSSQKAACV